VKSQNQRDLERHWGEQSKKLTPAERLAMKAEKLRKQIERDKAILERHGKNENTPQPPRQVTVSSSETEPGKAESSESARRRARE